MLLVRSVQTRHLHEMSSDQYIVYGAIAGH
jgi:hypothetical protein